MKAMILAAGRGTRMRNLTRETPKPLLRVGGKALIDWQIERLRVAGLTEIIINHAYLGHLIEQHLGDGRHLGVHIRYSPETQALETAGGIRQALPLLGDRPFLVVNADVFCDADLARLAAHAGTLDEGGDLAHLLLTDNPEHNRNGDFAVRNGRIGATHDRRLTFTGVGLYHPQLFTSLKPREPARLAPLLHQAVAANRVGASEHHGCWVDVGTPERLAELDRKLRAAPPS